MTSASSSSSSSGPVQGFSVSSGRLESIMVRIRIDLASIAVANGIIVAARVSLVRPVAGLWQRRGVV